MSLFALSILFEDVRARLLADGTTANVVFGKREPAKQDNQGPGRANRVVFVPGVGGSAGSYGPPKFPGRRPRPLMTWLETAQIYVWGYDGANPNDERLQYEAAHELHDQVVRCMYLSRVGHGMFELSDPQWLDTKVERRMGAELVFTVEIQSAVLDDPPVPAQTEVTPTEITGQVEIDADGSSATLQETVTAPGES